MNVLQLREVLSNFSDETIVRFEYDYGDYNHHLVAHEVDYIDLQAVKKSEYVDDFVIDDNENGEFLEDENYAVVLS